MASVTGTQPQTVVVGVDSSMSVLPAGASPRVRWEARATLRWDRGQFSAVGDGFLLDDPNRTAFRDAGTGIAEPTFTRATSFGFDLALQVRF